MSIQLGKIITDDNAERDAIHVAVAPVVAGEKLTPGQDIGLREDGRVGVVENPIGIVDPYLKNLVFPEQKIWLFLYPETVTGMRHHWSHSIFDKPPKSESVTWLQSVACDMGLEYDQLIAYCKEYVEDGTYKGFGDTEATDTFYSLNKETFWSHFEIATGLKVKDFGAIPFSCAC